MGAVQLHAFGPLVAAGLVGWSLLAIQQRRLLPRWPWNRPSPQQAPALAAALGVTLLGYWVGRLVLQLI
jgi:hypothetical protein